MGSAGSQSVAELLDVYFMADRLAPALVFLVVVGIFAAVRHSERIKASEGPP
jgi:hypothetical protein